MSIEVGFKVSRSSLSSSTSEQAVKARAKGWKTPKPFEERGRTARAHLFVLVQEGAAAGLKKESGSLEPKALETALWCRRNYQA